MSDPLDASLTEQLPPSSFRLKTDDGETHTLQMRPEDIATGTTHKVSAPIMGPDRLGYLNRVLQAHFVGAINAGDLRSAVVAHLALEALSGTTMEAHLECLHWLDELRAPDLATPDL